MFLVVACHYKIHQPKLDILQFEASNFCLIFRILIKKTARKLKSSSSGGVGFHLDPKYIHIERHATVENNFNQC